MKGGQSAARQHRRAMKKAGVAVAVREVVEQSTTTSMALAVSRALLNLEREGADMSSRIAITVGDDHPNFPGRTVVEAKAAASVEPTLYHGRKQDVRDETHPVDCAECPDPDRDDAGS